MKRLSLNMDLGELPGESEELYSIATRVNIACGGHAGDRASMERALVLARRAGATVAAHPSYPDRAGFGRTSMGIAADELERSLHDQMASLVEVSEEIGVSIIAVKPHGALYHDVAKSAEIAKSLIFAVGLVFQTQVRLVGPPRGVLIDLAANHSYEREAFADRAYLPDGSLVPRSQPGALITDPGLAAAQAVRLALLGEFDTLCVHGDTPGAVEIARAVRQALKDADLLERLS
ncbi:MAG: LamB/YcsF family protein [Polyangiaceae bacterium]|nr:LamB/YcsF family protein [Polyangiaceae bacterium]